MSAFASLAPMLVMVAITFVLMFGMVITRRRAVMDKKVDPKDLLVRGGSNPWPKEAAQFSDAYSNCFELPTVFYALVLAAFVTKRGDLAFMILAWAFVAFRAAQAYIHTTSNTRKYRSYAFRGGALVLVVMWLWFVMCLALV